MGNQLKISQAFHDFRNQNNNHTFDELRQKVTLINEAFKQNHKKLQLNILLSTSSIRFEPFNWKKSTVKGTIQIQVKNKMAQLRQSQEGKPKMKQNIVFSFQDVNSLYKEMKNLEKLKQTSKGQPLNIQQNQTPLQMNTPGQTPSDTVEQCCICFENTPSMVLPCSHAFCDNCTIKYIVEAEQKKCPQCRHQIKGSRQSVQRQIYTLIQEDEYAFDQVKYDILQVLKNLNSRIAKNIQEILKDR